MPSAIIENGVPLGVDVAQALGLQPGGDFTPDVIIDVMACRPSNELLPKMLLRRRLDGPGRIKVGLLNKKPAARLEPARQFADNRAAFGQVMQERAKRNEVVGRIGRLVVHDVEFAHGEIAADPVHQIGADVGGDDVSGGSDALREPPRQRTIARADLQAMPARRNARAQQMKPARRVEQVRHQPQPVGFAP